MKQTLSHVNVCYGALKLLTEELLRFGAISLIILM